MILIADSGSTKTAWKLIDGKTLKETFQTEGINPVRDNEGTIKSVLEKLDAYVTVQPSHIYFYGAGCIPPYSTTIRILLQQKYPDSKIVVESDMMGAAIALCGHSEGIACILGTGANSCLFDGTRITAQTPALGFILGDEGSGAVLGKRLIGDVLKKQLPTHIQQAFVEETGLTQATIIEKVYRKAQPNLFLASQVPFLERHKDEECIHQLVVEEMQRFLVRNIRNYNRSDLPVNFVGGLTNSFKDELVEALQKEGMKLGKIIQSPIDGMAEYHLQ